MSARMVLWYRLRTGPHPIGIERDAGSSRSHTRRTLQHTASLDQPHHGVRGRAEAALVACPWSRGKQALFTTVALASKHMHGRRI